MEASRLSLNPDERGILGGGSGGGGAVLSEVGVAERVRPGVLQASSLCKRPLCRAPVGGQVFVIVT